jgi:lipopolysaccharide/colanic/teichoic acid biosynthesis glycosyltransferase
MQGFDVKRVFDILASACGLIVLAPLMLATAAAVRMFLGSPILFRQVRPGLGGKPFELVKFRTMINARSETGAPLPDDQRMTGFGHFLRSSSLDELPQLWNVLRGDMSLVGPRPLLVQYLPLYSSHQARRHEVRPGLTGWSQVKGRNALSWDEKLDLDVWYVDNRSFFLDLRIIFMTAKRLIRPKGISAQGHATMPEFFGSAREDGGGPKD